MCMFMFIVMYSFNKTLSTKKKITKKSRFLYQVMNIFIYTETMGKKYIIVFWPNLMIFCVHIVRTTITIQSIL